MHHIIKIILPGLVSFLFLFSCASNVKTISQEPILEQKEFKGTWILKDYEFEKINENLVDVKLFRVIERTCLKGSEWTFMPNNASGVYRLNGINCNGEYFFKWNVVKKNELDYFQLKYNINEVNGKNIADEELRLNVVSIKEDEIIMKQDVLFDGKEINIYYTFNKKEVN